MTRALALPVALGAAVALGFVMPGPPGLVLRYAALGAFPGLALAEALARREGAPFRFVLGLAAAPLVASLLAWAALAAGLPLATAARAVALAGFAAWVLLRLRSAPSGPDAAFSFPRGALLVALAAATVTAIPYLGNAWMLVRSDAWVHGGLTWEIVTRGIPPEDPRYAGMPLNYVWMFNLYLAAHVTLGGGNLFVLMALFNVVNAAVFLLLIARLAGFAWGTPRAVVGAVALTALGLNAGAWVLWPLYLLRAVIGENTGVDEVMRELGTYKLGSWRVLYSLSAPWAHMLSLLDKFTVGTALNYAWISMLVLLWAGLAWLAAGGVARLAWAAFGVAGMLFFHGVVGLSVLPVALGTLGVAWLAGGRLAHAPPRPRLLALALACALGGLLALPYTIAISRGWAAGASGIRHQYLRPDLVMPWTLLTACGVALAFAIAGWRRAERRPEAWWLAAFTLAMTVFAVVVRLPDRNDSKFVFQVFFPLAVLGGAAFLPWTDALSRRRGAVVPALLLFLLFGYHPAVVLGSYLADPERHTAPKLNPRPGEPAMYAWMRDSTDARAVFVDRHFRDLVMVKGARRLYLGWRGGPEKAGFPRDGLARRRAVMEDLYGPQARLDEDVRALAELGDPVYVILRPEDGGLGRLRRGLEASGLTPAWERDGIVVLELPGGSRASAPAGP